MKVISTNTYEVAYYKMTGAIVDQILFRKMAENQKKKLGIFTKYVFKLNNVSQEAYDQWKSSEAVVNVKEFMNSRLKLKKTINKLNKQRHEAYQARS